MGSRYFRAHSDNRLVMFVYDLTACWRVSVPPPSPKSPLLYAWPSSCLNPNPFRCDAGTDEYCHPEGYGPNSPSDLWSGYVVSEPGQTGAYISLGCTFHMSQGNTSVDVLNNAFFNTGLVSSPFEVVGRLNWWVFLSMILTPSSFVL